MRNHNFSNPKNYWKKKIEYGGETLSVKRWSRRYGVTSSFFYCLYKKHGISIAVQFFKNGSGLPKFPAILNSREIKPIDQSELQKIRYELGFTMLEFSKLLGVHVNSYQYFEREKRKCSRAVLLAALYLKHKHNAFNNSLKRAIAEFH